MKPRFISLGLLSICMIAMLSINCTQRTDVYEDYSWIPEIRKDHPRLFFNRTSFQGIKEWAIHEEKDIFEAMKARIDALIGQEIEFVDPLAIDGAMNNNHHYGTRAAESAFVYLVTNDRKYLSLTKEILVKLTEYYQLRNENNLNIDWHSISRINALTAFDWVCSDLTNKERRDIGRPLLEAISFMIPGEGPEEREPVFRKNTGPITGGFYGDRTLAWYAGLVFYREGIDDGLAERLLLKGYDDHTALLENRSNISGDDGGAATAALMYCMGNYPWAEFNFFHTFHSATGLDIAKDWPYVPGLVNYIFWNWLPDDRQFGWGDQSHRDNKLPLNLLHLHLCQMIHFYGGTQPELIARVKWMKTKVQKQQQDRFPFTRFLLTRTYDEIEPEGPSEVTPIARHFVNMGQVFLRSGSGPHDTYAVFSGGGMLTHHRHYDNNNFVIFRKGFVTLDTGTRPSPGLHLPYYYCRTVAHNCITIKMPGEKMPDYWGFPALSEQPAPPVPNDGGQCDRMGSEIVAFDEKDRYAYIASDATDAYHQDKASLVLRQFVFLPPDHFVVFDRVNSTRPEYTKRWLSHSANEPIMISSDEFSTEHWDGRLFCRTLIPEGARLTRVGGPGKEFWSDGRNWPLPELTPEDWNYRGAGRNYPEDNLYGQWRMEVTPDESRTDDIFLHLIQVGDKDTLESMVSSTVVRSDDMVGVRFDYDNKVYEVMFATKGKAAGKITISQDDQPLLDEKFTEQVKPQKVFF